MNQNIDKNDIPSLFKKNLIKMTRYSKFQLKRK